ncbi:DUF2807 domain-containing protein [uncultured Alistipes sp.]|uniref:GIN domain-containing protein n=1 Tax=uncultured Alistipes sp. TaxID=538949 RepID=UPI00259AD2C6|nr:DUF2807 domain-containing protein [uncultured Alistipes sp.]
MKHPILSAMALLMMCTAHAQAEFETQASVGQASTLPVSPTERSEWLASFTAVEVDASVDLLFVRTPDNKAPRIVYDTKGDSTTKFRAEIKNQTLRIRERADIHRRDRTIVTVYYTTLESLRLTDATVRFEGPLKAKLFDLTVGARSSVEAEIDVQDLMMDLSGEESRAKLHGQVRYLTLFASTGVADAAGVVCETARVVARNKARVSVDAIERLEARATSGAKIDYKTEPKLLRFSQSTPWFPSDEKEK